MYIFYLIILNCYNLVMFCVLNIYNYFISSKQIITLEYIKMTTYNGKINLFDCATSQTIIGQDKFLNSFKNILDHGAYCQGP